ncbi:hypothetical protein Ocin01_02056 [Orchesella cincta]|uniref:Uncharacterized protein n=1 Tax=Orchesella cincta TaxID=48709 RepID=A0A1D2NHP9_ORCCI|nr:hypothetical protein Ocin01_02056 [Orchesella cincta]
MGNFRFPTVEIVFYLLFMVKVCFTNTADIKVGPDQENKGWLRLCNKDSGSSQHYEVEADKCPHGAWLSESLQGGCVCLNGLWAISQSWCDEDYFVVYGKGHCFQLNNKIQKLAFLGNAKNPFESTNFLTKENGHVFRSFSDEFMMPYEYSTETNRTILRLRPGRQSRVVLEVKPSFNDWQEFRPVNEVWVDEEEPVCFETDEKNWTEDLLLIYKIKTGIKYIKVTEECPKPLFYDAIRDPSEHTTVFKLLPGQAIHMKSGTIIKASNNCPSDCASNDGSSLTELSKLIRHKRQADDDGPDFEPLELDQASKWEQKDYMNNVANLRVAKLELNWLLNKKRPPVLKTTEWRIMKRVKEVFVKACPNEEAPKFLANAMMRIFRLLYIESKDFYQNGHELEDKLQLNRILNHMDSCINEAKEYKFQYKWVKQQNAECRNGTRPGDPTVGNQEVRYCWCNYEMENVEFKYAYNTSTTDTDFNATRENNTITDDHAFYMSKKDRFNGSLYDFPIETVWKMISFSHYYCAKYFHLEPADHSAMMVALESLFSDEIIYRWTKPGSQATRVWQYLFSTFDLKKFAASMDTCVATAKYLSEYPYWISRPTLQSQGRKKRSLDREELWKGSAYCLDDPWDPVEKLGVNVPNKCADLNRY